MIVTLTANPSLDRTAALAGPLARGGVNRARAVTVEPGGKGVNVARVVTLAGQPALAVLPADPAGPLVAALARLGVPHLSAPTTSAARTNLTVTEPDGTTTKINEPGVPLSEAEAAVLAELLLDAAGGGDGASRTAVGTRTAGRGGPVAVSAGAAAAGTPGAGDGAARTVVSTGTGADGALVAVSPGTAGAGHPSGAGDGADWVALSGSLPPGVPVDWYGALTRRLRAAGRRVAVDTSDAPLRALAAGFPAAAPDLLKPNAEELAQLSGGDPEALEAAAAAGDLAPTVGAARRLLDQGVGAVLATLGGAGAVLVTAAGAWAATPPPITLRSTVGAGDSALAGYLIAAVAGRDEPARLRHAVAYGSGAAALAGTALPRPDQTDPDRVDVVRLP
ncbi:1-phosphofructokinase family hexose kinase [Georgenia sp. TF02-10]|uniref:1-phosphofructokinase family hexose kinase n=1 Tax=Georgenia sp. TF02-10 TaxID=2917725 RepID=UPI001FA7BA31|nr:1-phosphofructokinase family hexose kinase [Georgenia sp. TF02-10]UNX53851.1 1-phosphofructokinase family hexose kinase [Georgenia sp. TF02-10]